MHTDEQKDRHMTKRLKEAKERRQSNELAKTQAINKVMDRPTERHTERQNIHIERGRQREN